jgi:hypothetical protein
MVHPSASDIGARPFNGRQPSISSTQSGKFHKSYNTTSSHKNALVKSIGKERKLSNYTSKKTSPYPKYTAGGIKPTAPSKSIADNKRSVVVNNNSHEFLSPKQQKRHP